MWRRSYNDDFEGGCPWNGVQDEIVEEDVEEEIGVDEAAAGNKGMGDRKYTHAEVEKAGRMQRGSSSDEMISLELISVIGCRWARMI